MNSIFESVSEAILILDEEGRVVGANPAATELYARSQEQMLGMGAKVLFRPRDVYKLELCLDRAKRLGKDSKYKALHQKKSGEKIHVLVRSKSAIIKGERRVALFINDITQREHTEQRLRRAQVEAEASAIAKSQFLANISHEIRTPMNLILGYAGLMEEEDMEAVLRKQFAQSILKNGETLVKLIDELLDLCKVEMGSLRVEKEMVALYPLVKEVIAQQEKLWASKDIQFSLDFRVEASCELKTDPMRLKQILSNLLNNAAKFTQQGQARLKIYYSGEKRVVFQVSDTGIGIPENEWKRLFSPFAQVDGSSTRQFGGSGLGLAVGKHLAQVLGGNLYLKRSLPGKGSVFEFWLERSVEESADIEFASEGGTPPSSYPTLKSAKILLVEDMEENQALIKMYLKQLDCNLDIAGDGKEALEMLKRRPYDLILMDLQMPRMDGFSATDILRKQGVKTPIIALTARAMKEDVEQCMRAGFNGHLSKPVRSKQLICAVNQTLSGRPTGA